jgi:hypothetical protein
MKISTHILTYLVLILILFLSSCTIEKRVHRKGYHVEWIHSHNKTSENEQKQMEKQEVTELNAAKKQNGLIVKKEEQHNLKEEFQIDTVTHKKNIVYVKETWKELTSPAPVQHLYDQSKEFKSDQSPFVRQNSAAPSSNKTKEIEKMGLWAFIFVVVGLFVSTLLGLALLVMALLLSISSLIKILDNPDKYSGKGFTIFALVVSLITIILIVL